MIGIHVFEPSEHYDAVSGWWQMQGWPVIPLSHLPINGIVTSIDGELAAAGWIYKTDSAFCLFEWVVANPQVRHEKRTQALDALIATAKAEASRMGFQSVFMSVRSASLIGRLEKHGFQPTDQNVTNLILNLGGGE